MGTASRDVDRLVLQQNDFPGKIATIHWVYGEITRKLIEGGETVAILVQDANTKRKREAF